MILHGTILDSRCISVSEYVLSQIVQVYAEDERLINCLTFNTKVAISYMDCLSLERTDMPS